MFLAAFSSSAANRPPRHRKRVSWRPIVKVKRNRTLVILIILAATALAGCKKTDDTSRNTLSSGSSGVMSNSAGLSGTPGSSDAAKRASDAAASSGASASASASASAAQ
jgi:hypothetical protein